MKLRERLLNLLSGRTSSTRDKLSKELGLPRHEQHQLDNELHQLVRKGIVLRDARGRFSLPKEADLITGKILFRQSGAALVIVSPEPGKPDQPAIQIDSADTATALHGDQVAVKLNEPPRSRHREKPDEPTGRVVRVIKRDRDTLTGGLARNHDGFTVIPDDPRFVQEVRVAPPKNTKLRPEPLEGDKVIVRLDAWTNRNTPPTGEIIEVLGRVFEPRAELAAIYHKYRLPTQFPEDVEKEASVLPDKVRAADRANRRDIRELPTITIDPDDAKDFDDALSLEILPRGECRIGVHIADVSSYVRPGTALDKEAQTRGNSTYLVGTVVPMLPHKLSSGLCSLKEAEDRLTKSVFFTFTRTGKIAHTEFANTVICSRKRLTYRQAYALLKEDDLETVRRMPAPPAHQTGFAGRRLSELSHDELGELQQMIRAFWKIASQLRSERFELGALELDMPETKIFVDAEGYADRLEKIENDESHQLIEEFMLLANQAVAHATRTHQLPSLYRVHDDPDETKLAEFRLTAGTYGVRCGDLTNRAEMVKMLSTLRSHPQGQILRIQLLRSLKRACYRGSPDGHYGLAKRDYSHFTSPIRRYADLVVHRVFDLHLEKNLRQPVPPGTRADLRGAKIASLADHLSITEANSTEAERDSVKLKLLEFFERQTQMRQPDVFEATILEIRSRGMFVELVESQAYGFVASASLRGDEYFPGPANTALIGRRTRHRFELGQRIHVVISRVDRQRRQIDFAVVGSEKPQAKKPTARR